MLRPITTSSASAGGAPTAVHASAAANLSPHQSGVAAVAGDNTPSQAGNGSAGQMLRYNSFEFIYRQDIGRIVLIGQSPETGERVNQVPSEQALRAYEQTQRAERQATGQDSEPVTQQATFAATATTPQLAKALVAAISGGDNHGSAMVSVSA